MYIDTGKQIFKKPFYSIEEILGPWEISCILPIFCRVKVSLRIYTAINNTFPNIWHPIPEPDTRNQNTNNKVTKVLTETMELPVSSATESFNLKI